MMAKRYDRIALGVAIAGIAASAMFAGTSERVEAQAVIRNVWTGVYTPDQAQRGAEAYAKQCAGCHGAALGGIDVAPALTGPTFLNNWNNTTAADLHQRIQRTMPLGAPGSLAGRTVSDIMAFMMNTEGMPAGDLPLPPNPALMPNVVITAQPPEPETAGCTCAVEED